MKSLKWATLAVALVVVAGCATAKTWQATGGSRSDGTVRLSYEVGLLEVPTVDDAQGLTLARQRCATWGYSGAEAFGGTTSQCTYMGSSGCMTTLVTKEFQCTGTGTPGATASIFVR
ncbi:YecR family lipoprotein [Brevundimonas sp. TWP2-3-4b1]|uniref:YecR family lipoprotein n=1 Tax=Brevundimonas sp. TWP2-3-4b1 TaxID=2804580 RepID=UPI003CEE2AAB